MLIINMRWSCHDFPTTNKPLHGLFGIGLIPAPLKDPDLIVITVLLPKRIAQRGKKNQQSPGQNEFTKLTVWH